MKRLILVRHGKADQEKSGNDFERSLIKKGRKDSKLIANVLVKNNIKADLLVSSDAHRALETAKIFAEEMQYTPAEIEQEHFLYEGYTTGQLADFLSNLDSKIETVIIFGHNPFISQSGIRLSKNFHQSFPTAGCLGLKFDVKEWHLEPGSGDIDFFEFPKKYL
ncbi:MAG TPA: histidine phosphatase family protein [Salinivirga sp.]|uniref:Acid phosphatase n=1 Tax=Salinivirga cyanobacteriivorans TaxID=1307839 RepID=A0A0S2I460_9BACT|nr:MULTISPECIES: histidine phosphatase family protein [Salinivirga]ALO17104.1 acid phosphatase [Salinivirga cyanobacteriivorans]HKK60565.1 histidine phosphatase family protein [Salinivirga sp.]